MLNSLNTLCDNSIKQGLCRFISLQKGEEGTAFALLAALLQSKLVEPSVEPWKWLGQCIPSSEAVDFVSSHLNSYAIPENFRAISEVSQSKQAALFPLRRQLFDWLLPVPREAIGLLNTQGAIGALRQNLSIRASPQKVAQLLFILTQRDPRAVANSMKITRSKETEDDSLKWERFIYSMGQAYLQSAFSKVVTENVVEVNGPVAALGSSVVSLQLLLCEQISELSELLSEPIEMDTTMLVQDRQLAEVERLKFSAYHCSVVAHTVAFLTSAKAISLESLKDSRLMVSLSRLLHSLASQINESSLQCDSSLDQAAEIGLTLLHYLESMLSALMFSNSRVTDDDMQFKQLRQIFAELMPPPLLDWLCSMSCHQIQSSQAMHAPLSAQSPLLGTAPSQMDETSFIGNSSIADGGNSQFVDGDFTPETQSSNDVPASLMSITHLPNSSKLRIQAAKLLSMLWCLWDEDSSNPSWQAVCQFVDGLLDPETLDLSRLQNVHVVVAVCSTLCSSCLRPSLKLIDTVLEALRTVLAKHYHDQQVATCVLDILAQLAWHFQYPADKVKESDAGNACKRVLEAFCGLLYAGKLGANARLSLVLVIRNFIMVDPKSHWTTLSRDRKSHESGGNRETLHEVLISLLADKEHAVRMKAAASVEILFTKQEANGANIIPFHRSLQEQMFSVLCDSIKNAYALPAGVDEGLRDTEAQNRSSSVLLTLVNVAKCSVVCRKMALFQLFNHSLYDGTTITEKALSLLASQLGYSSSKNFLELHLDFLISSWLESKQPLSSYPFRFHGFTSRTDFFQTYRRAVLPYALLHPDTQQLELIGGDVGCDWVELLKSCLPRCMVFILPVFAKQESPVAETMSQEEREGFQIEQRRAKRAHEILQSKMSVSKILLSEIDNFIVELLLRIHEEQDGESFLARYSSACDPEPNPPYYTPQCIKAVLHDLVERGHDIDSLVDLLSCQQDTIQSILLLLKSHLVNTCDAHEKKRRLMGYGLFVELMAEEIKSGLGGSQAYLVRDVIVTIVDCLKCASKGYTFGGLVAWETTSLCCGILLTVCRAAIQTCPQVLGNHLHLIVNCLTEMATQQQRGGEEAFSLLDALITKSDCPQLRPYISMLDPFPDLELFAPLRRVHYQIRQSMKALTLEEDIKRFLSVDQHCPPEARLEGLRCLKAQLRQHTKEMGQVNSTVVRKLICRLIRLASQSQKTANEQSNLVVSEVADCLGELGAIDIGSVALSTASDEEENQPYYEALCNFLTEPEYFRSCKVIHLLNSLLTDASVDVVASAAICLKSILATKYGDEFLVLYEERGIDDTHEYLHPFKSAKEELHNPTVTSHDQLFVQHVDQSDLWWPPGLDGQRSHGQWVQDMTTALLQSGGVTDPMLILLQPACQAKVSFAENIFPNLIHNILEAKNPVYRTVLSTQIQGFLTKLQTAKEIGSDGGSVAAKESIKLILDTINYLRTTNRDKTSNPWQNNFWLDVNYLSLAVAAQMCSAYFTSLLYVEIWQDAKKSSQVAYFSTPSSMSLSSSSLDVVSSGGGLLRRDSLLTGSHHSVLLEAYSQIGEPEALQGAAVVCSSDSSIQLKIYEQEGQWERALGLYDLQLQGCTAGSKASVVESLKHLGLNHVATTYMQGLWNTDSDAAAAIMEHQYELAWRNCMWNLDVESRSLSSGSGFHHALHSCLHALSNREFGPFHSSLNQARSIVMSNLTSASLESVLGIYPILGRLQSLVEMKEICRLMRKYGPYDSLATQWKDRLSLVQDEFVHIEPVWAVRTSLLRTMVEGGHQSSDSNEQRESLIAGLSNHLKSEADVARQAGCHQVSEQAVFNLKLLCNQLPPDERIALDWICQMKEAELLWSRGEQTVALRAIASLQNELDQAHINKADVNLLYAHVLLLLGNWLAESHSEQPAILVDKYLEPAANLLSQSANDSETNTSLMKAYFSLARYADQRYRKIADYMESSVFETKKDLMQQQKV
jgi:ataxia telangiectasia mutated family protein